MDGSRARRAVEWVDKWSARASREFQRQPKQQHANAHEHVDGHEHVDVDEHEDADGDC